MLTKNGRAVLYARNSDQNNNHNTAIKLLKTDNSDIDLNYYNRYGSGTPVAAYTYLVQSLLIIVGSGSTTPTIEDYNLANPINNNNLSVISRSSRNYETKQGNYTNSPIMHSTVTYQNLNPTSLGSEGNIAVNEIGLIGWIPSYGEYGTTTSIFADKDYSTAYSNTYYKPNPTTGISVLLAREVLETPVIIAPGETATFTITVA